MSSNTWVQDDIVTVTGLAGFPEFGSALGINGDLMVVGSANISKLLCSTSQVILSYFYSSFI